MSNISGTSFPAAAASPTIDERPVAHDDARDAATRQAPRAERRIVELDGVRAIALCLMLANHLLEAPPNDGSLLAKFPGILHAVVHHGFQSIDIFFVLSGYLITGNLLKAKSLGTRGYFSLFYTRRALRILPLYFVFLVSIWLIYGPQTYLPWLGLGALLSANLSGIFNIAVPAAAGPFWSLGVEEQFYLLWPWLVLFLPRRALVGVTVAIVVIEPVLRLWFTGPDLVLTWFHSDGLAIGAMIAVLFSKWNGNKKTVLIAVAAFVGAFVAVTVAAIPFGVLNSGGPVPTMFRITQASLMSGALVTLSVGYSGAPWLAILRTRILVLLATYSFCIYLIHRPLIDVYQNILPKALPVITRFNGSEATIARTCFVLIVAYAVASLSWKYFEGPILRTGR